MSLASSPSSSMRTAAVAAAASDDSDVEDRSIMGLGLFPTTRSLIAAYFAVPSDISRSGIQLFVLGAVLATLKKSVEWLMACIDRTCIARVEIDSRDEVYRYVTHYLGDTKGEDALHFTIASPTRKESSDGSAMTASPLSWIPAPGTHLWFFRSRPMLITRSLNGEAGQSNLLKGSQRLETMSIATISTTPKILHAFIENARTLCLKQDLSRTVVFNGNQYGDWQRLHARPIRPLKTVILSPALLDPLLEDVKNYLSRETEEWYASRGIPYRRGYLFSGPPGTGKTSLAVALAGEFKLGVYVVSLGGKGMRDDILLDLLGNMPRRSILLLEDIDVAFANRAISAVPEEKRSLPREETGVTSSGLLNALDGVAAQEGRIVILTTNYLDRLDAALIRPGRVDMRIDFKLATRDDIHALFSNFFTGEHISPLAQQFSAHIPEKTFSIAAIQGYLMTYKHDPHSATKHIVPWVLRHS